MNDDKKHEPLKGELLPPEKERSLARSASPRPVRLPFFAKLSEKMSRAETDLHRAEEERLEAQVSHARAFKKLDRLDGILEKDEIAFEREYLEELGKRDAATRSLNLDRMEDENIEKKLKMEGELLDARLQALKAEPVAPKNKRTDTPKKSPIERAEERIKKRAEAMDRKRALLQELRLKYQDTMPEADLEHFLAQAEADFDNAIDDET